MSKWKTELISVCHDIIQLKNDLNYYGNELKLTQDSFLPKVLRSSTCYNILFTGK